MEKPMNNQLFFALVLFSCLLFSLNTTAQNLVPNPGFEEYVMEPPGSVAGINVSIDWFRVGTTTDFFHRNFGPTSIGGVPYNLKGYQEPASGDGYAGIIASAEAAEYLAVELTQPLEKEVLYEVGFKVNLANVAQLASDDVGMTFLQENPLDIIANTDLNREAIYHLKNEEGKFITDTVGWTSVDGYYLAEGGESFLVIGNFYQRRQTDVFVTGSDFPLIYFYIDDVYVQSCDAQSITEMATTDTTICEETTAQLQGLPDADSYYWEGLDATPSIEVEAAGTYVVNNFKDCTNTRQVFEVKTGTCDCSLQVPSIQLAGASLKTIPSLEVQSYKLHFFDASGKLVTSISSNQLEELRLPPYSAIYFWQAELSCLNGLSDDIIHKTVGGKVVIMNF